MQLFKDIHASLKPSSYFLFDLSQKEPYVKIFQNGGLVSMINIDNFHDEVRISFHLNVKHCDYRETVSGMNNGQQFAYTEEFVIRFLEY